MTVALPAIAVVLADAKSAKADEADVWSIHGAFLAAARMASTISWV